MDNELSFEPLSNFDLQDFFSEIKGKKCNIKMYDEIKKMKKIEQVFENNNYCIIFVSNPDKNVSMGHWVTTFFNNPNECNFFCSYGTPIDKICPKLKPLLFQKFGKICYNKMQYQEYGDNSATCGRFCILNVGLSNLVKNFNLFQMYEFLEGHKEKMHENNYNDVVSKFVNNDL